jgi:hypothetical protein
VLIEVVFKGPISLDQRDELEDALEAALTRAKLGEVTGAGIGIGRDGAHLDVEVLHVTSGVALIRETLAKAGAAEVEIIVTGGQATT